MLDHGLPLTLAIAQDLVDTCLLVPAGYGEEVLLVGGIGVESEVGNRVLGGLAKFDILLEIAEGVTRRRGGRTEQTSHGSLDLVVGAVRLESSRGSLQLVVARIGYLVARNTDSSNVTVREAVQWRKAASYISVAKNDRFGDNYDGDGDSAS